MAVKKSFDMVSWTEWPDEEIKMRDEAAVKRYERKLKDDVDFWKFVQFKFYEQWESFRAYVNGLGIKIFGRYANLCCHGQRRHMGKSRAVSAL